MGTSGPERKDGPTRLRRGIVAGAGAVIGATAALAGHPFGTYRPEAHLGAILLGAALGGVAGGLLPSTADLPRRTRWILQGVAALLIGLLAHPAGIAVAFSLAVERRQLFTALVAGVLAARVARRWTPLEWSVVGLAPLLLITTVHHATFLRSPGVDCSTLATAEGVTPLSVWPLHVDPTLHNALVYDVVADEDYVAAAFVRRGERAGCGAVVVWDRDAGYEVLEVPFTSGMDSTSAWSGGCWMTARLVLEDGRLTVPFSSYDPDMPPWIGAWDLSPGPKLTPRASVPLVLDPSDLVLHDGRLVLLAYPRRFASDGHSAAALLDPGTLQTLHVERFEPDGWMTEHLVPSGDALFVTDLFGHLYELDGATLQLRREVKPGASMLGGAAAGDRLFVAAPYRREALVLDRGSLEVLAALPGGDALRDLEVDHDAQRLYGIGYGDGRLHGWSLEGGGAALGSLEVGRPLRGMDLADGRLWTAGGCGVFAVDPAVLEGR